VCRAGGRGHCCCKDLCCPACSPMCETIRTSSQCEGPRGSQHQSTHRHSFDNHVANNNSGGDVVSPAQGSVSPSPSASASVYERDPKSTKTEGSRPVVPTTLSALTRTNRRDPPTQDSALKVENKAGAKQAKENADHSLLNKFTTKVGKNRARRGPSRSTGRRMQYEEP
jgi:hypothetical protein